MIVLDVADGQKVVLIASILCANGRRQVECLRDGRQFTGELGLAML